MKLSISKLSGFTKAIATNNLFLLLVGAAISSFVVPTIQSKFEARKIRQELMKECFSQFLLYSNSLWQEYYATIPLTQRLEIDQNEYLLYVNKVAEVKLKRYDAYARIQALAITFRGDRKMDSSQVEKSIKAYAVNLNAISGSIDAWMKDMYCTPVNRERSPCEDFNPDFNAYRMHIEIKKKIVNFGNDTTDNVASQIIQAINGR